MRSFLFYIHLPAKNPCHFCAAQPQVYMAFWRDHYSLLLPTFVRFALSRLRTAAYA